MRLEKSQLKFLQSLLLKEITERKDISESPLDIVLFLEKQELIKAKREIIDSCIDYTTRKYKNTYGRITSISISEKGKAYLEEMRHEEESSKREEHQRSDFMQYVEKIAKSAETQSDVALKTSKKADVKGWIAVIISVLGFVWSILSKFL